MNIHQLSDDGGVLLNSIRRRRLVEPPRTGLHLSTILDDFDEEAYGERLPNEKMTRSRLLFQEVGNALEDIIADGIVRLNPLFTKPAPRCSDGVWMSPDGDSPLACAIHEMKATWVSAYRFVELGRRVSIISQSRKLQRYIRQVMAYCRAWNYYRACLHVLFLCGDYRPPFPWSVTYNLTFTDDDLDDNWRIVLQHRDDRGERYWLRKGVIH